jgi:hypothetical protein
MCLPAPAAMLALSLAMASVTVGCGQAAQPPAYVEGELLVKFRAGVSMERMAEIHRTMGNRPAEHWPRTRWSRVLLQDGVSVPEALQQYLSLPEVEAAEPNYTRQLPPSPRGSPTPPGQ